MGEIKLETRGELGLNQGKQVKNYGVSSDINNYDYSKLKIVLH